MLTKIINGRVLTPQGWREDESIILCDGKIAEVTTHNIELPLEIKVSGAEDAASFAKTICSGVNPENASCVIDAHRAYVIPGGVDIHVHGGGGYDFMECSEEAFRAATAAHLRHGTTAIYPTLAASSNQIIRDAAVTTQRLMSEPDSPIMGLHLEGPYFNPRMAGAQIPEYIRHPLSEEYVPLLEDISCIKRWDAAPELPGALEFARYITERGIIAAVGHTEADFEVITAAREAGYSHATHLYNAMTGVHKRREFKHEGTIESLLYYDDMSVELIADGIHIPPAILRLVYKIKGPQRISLITDAMACAISNGGKAFDERVIIEDGVCKLDDRSALAGSIATMDRLIRTMVTQADVPLADAVCMASQTPARLMGIDHRKGSLERGKDADVVLLNDALEVCGVWSMGRLVDGTLRV